MTRSSNVLDLSALAGTGRKVKLPDKKLYDIANPAELGVLPQQRVISRYGAAKALMAKTDPTEKDLEEMLELLLDVCQVVVPAAPRGQLGKLDLPRMDRLIKDFLSASPATQEGEAATATRSTPAT